MSSGSRELSRNLASKAQDGKEPWIWGSVTASLSSTGRLLWNRPSVSTGSPWPTRAPTWKISSGQHSQRSTLNYISKRPLQLADKVGLFARPMLLGKSKDQMHRQWYSRWHKMWQFYQNDWDEKGNLEYSCHSCFRPRLVDCPTQIICIWIFICWVGGGISIQGVVKCSSSYFRQEWTF